MRCQPGLTQRKEACQGRRCCPQANQGRLHPRADAIQLQQRGDEGEGLRLGLCKLEARLQRDREGKGNHHVKALAIPHGRAFGSHGQQDALQGARAAFVLEARCGAPASLGCQQQRRPPRRWRPRRRRRRRGQQVDAAVGGTAADAAAAGAGAAGAAAATSAADAAASAKAFSSRRRALESAAAEATDRASIKVSTTLARPFSETFFTERSLKVKSSTCEKNADKDLACLSTGLVQSRVGPPPKILLVDFSAESVPNEFMLGRGLPQSRGRKGAVDKDF
mmetsp:Transcript_59666/g.194644  ORF Transcript_59666/g.194644 Transcript_59666/m.194644 type:complete len:279 (+) Transcript_59666:595-1431(+)